MGWAATQDMCSIWQKCSVPKLVGINGSMYKVVVLLARPVSHKACMYMYVPHENSRFGRTSLAWPAYFTSTREP